MSENSNDDIVDKTLNLKIIFFLLLDYWKSITAITFLAAVTSVFYALSLSNFYISTAVLKPAESASGMSSMLSQYSGLASLAGITLPTDAQMDNPTLALEVIKSRDFFESLYKDEQFLINITALGSYIKESKTVTIDPEIYNLEEKKWVREPSDAGNIKPSLQEAHELFLEENLIIGRDIKTGIVSISIKHISPYLAKDMAFKIVNNLNSYMKKEQTDLALKSKTFLEKQLSETRYQEMQKVLAALLEREMQTLLLSSITEDFVFEYLDMPRVPERKSGPKRAVICIYGTILGGFLAVLITLLRLFLPSFLTRE
jgi:uncharacterized protein involved in exopolysaccharide biosynthesis